MSAAPSPSKSATTTGSDAAVAPNENDGGWGMVQEGQSAVARAKAAQEASRKEAAALVEKGQEALGRKQPAAALEFFKLALQKAPGDSDAARLFAETLHA